MSDMVYLIVSGHYSDFRVYAAYTAKPRAEQVVSRLNSFGLGGYDDFWVQEVPLDMEPRPRKRYSVFVGLSDGEEIDRFCHSPDPWSSDPLLIATEDEQDDDAVLGESTRSYDAALKAAQDRRTRILARRDGSGMSESEWPDCPYAGETCAKTYARDPASFHGSKPCEGRGCLLPAAGSYCVGADQCLACPIPALAKQRADAVAAAAILRGTWERSREGTNIEVSWEDWEETVRQALAGLEGNGGK